LRIRSRAKRIHLQSMIRSVQAEILDTLDPNEPQAIRNRKELEKINHWMGNYRWIFKALSHFHPQVRKELIEIGAMGSPLPQYLKCSTSAGKWNYTGLDLVPAPSAYPNRCHWVQQPVESYEGWRRHKVLVSNFLLHQLEPQALQKLGTKMAKHLDLIVCNEPYRHPFFHFAANLLFRLFGYSETTQHDGLVSIRAGFKWGELPAMLGLQERNWNVMQSVTLLGSYRMVAIRKT
jgi:hypothetical protein